MRLPKVVFLPGDRSNDGVLRPATRPFSVELPAIEDAAESAVTCGNAGMRPRETTRKYVKRPADTPEVVRATPRPGVCPHES